MDWASRIAELMWGAGLAAIPLAIVASVCCRIKSFRPATRHAMWFAVLFTLLSPVLMAGVWRPAWFRSDRVMSVVNSLTPEVAARQEPVDTAAIVTDERPIEEAAPHQMDASLLSLVKDATPLGVTSSHAALSKEEFVGPLPAMVELPSVKSHPVATKPALVGLEKALLTPAPKPAPIAAVDRPARTAPVPVIKTSNATREWVTQLLAARDALAAVPSIPPVVWLVGASLLVSFWVARYVLIRRLIARADPAPASMVALVKRLAQDGDNKRCGSDEGHSPSLGMPPHRFRSISQVLRRSLHRIANALRPPAQNRLHRPHGQSLNPCDLPPRHPTQAGEHHHRLLPARQRLQRLLDQLNPFIPLQRTLSTGLTANLKVLQRSAPRRTHPGPVRIPCNRTRHQRNPRCRFRARRVESPRLLPYRQKRILAHVINVRATPYGPMNHASHQALEPLMNLFKRRRIPGTHSPDQLGIKTDHIDLSCRVHGDAPFLLSSNRVRGRRSSSFHVRIFPPPHDITVIAE